MLLGQTINDEIVYSTLLNVTITGFNLDAILSLLSLKVQIWSWLYEELVMKLVTHAIVASCLDQDTRNEYVGEKGFESLHQFLIAIWKLLVHWALQRRESEHSLGFSYLHWAAIMSAPEIARELIAGGADVFAKGTHGHVALDVVSLPFRDEEEGLGDIDRVYGILFREQVVRAAPPKDTTGPSGFDKETRRVFRRNAFIGTYEEERLF